MPLPCRKSVGAISQMLTRKERQPDTPLDLLKNALGEQDAKLLNALPLDKIEFAAHDAEDFSAFLGYRILLGTIVEATPANTDLHPWTLWAYMTKDTRRDALPEIYFYGFHPEGEKCTNWTADAVFTMGNLRQEFQIATYKRGALSALLKSCFILKGAQLPLHITFTAGFIKELRQVCRKYQRQSAYGLGQVSSSQGESSEADTSSRAPPIDLKMCMRKTQQRGPSAQLYDVLGSTLPDTPSSLQKAVGIGAFSNALHDTIEGLDDDDDGVEWDHLLSTPSIKGNTGVFKSGKDFSHKTTILNHSSSSVASRQGLFQRRPLGSRPLQSNIDNHTGTPCATSTPAPRLMPSTPTAPASMRSLDEYLALHTESEVLDTEMDTVSSDLKQTTSLYLKRRSNMCHYIDKEVPQAHNKAFSALKARQAEEVLELKAKYAALKKEQEEKTNILKQRQAEHLARKEELRRELAVRVDGMSKTDLLDALIAQHGANKRKRRESMDSVQ